MIKVLSRAASRMLSSSQCPVELLYRGTRVGTCLSSRSVEGGDSLKDRCGTQGLENRILFLPTCPR